jgi:hypothetical protein
VAGLRNAAISLLRLSGVVNIAEALREHLYHIRDLLTKMRIVNLRAPLARPAGAVDRPVGLPKMIPEIGA